MRYKKVGKVKFNSRQEENYNEQVNVNTRTLNVQEKVVDAEIESVDKVTEISGDNMRCKKIGKMVTRLRRTKPQNMQKSDPFRRE